MGTPHRRQRVQVIKYDAKKGGILQFGTEVVASADGSISALLGASPGASTAVSIMVDLIKRCFKEEFATSAWQAKIKEMIPSFGIDLATECFPLRKAPCPNERRSALRRKSLMLCRFNK